MKKLALAKETLLSLSLDSMKFIQGGMPMDTQGIACNEATSQCPSDGCPTKGSEPGCQGGNASRTKPTCVTIP